MLEETRGRIIAGAYHTLIRQGYEATSVKDIAREAGVPPGLIHYYFTSKEDLLVAAIRYGCNQVIPMQEVPSSLNASGVLSTPL